jgi:hypothetical protein
MQKRNILNSPRLQELKKKRRKVLLIKFCIFSFVFLLIFIGSAFLSRINKLKISEIEIAGNKVVDTEIIKGVAEEELAGNYLWFFSKKNIFLYSKDGIVEALSNKFERLKDINITTKDNKILEISVTERIPKYTWCGENLPEINTEDKTCYFLDDGGFIFDKAPYFSGEVYFKFFGKVNTEDGIPSGSYFSEIDFEQFIVFKKSLEDMGLRPVALYVMENRDVKVYLSDESSLPMGPEIIFKIDSDFQKIAENLQAALTTEPLQTDFKNKYSSLLYIDLRFGNKVYYKFR